MAVTPRLGILMMASNMAAKEQVFNEAVLAFDALFSGSVISAALTTPPASPSEGDCYIVPNSGATGAWAGMGNKIAFAYNGWQFVTPPDQYRVYNQATSSFLRYTTSSGWTGIATGTPSNLTDLLDVNAATPTDGDVLQYDSGTHKWVPYTLPTPLTNLHDMTDVNVTPGAGINGHFLKYDSGSGKWVSSAIPSPSTSLAALSDVDNTTFANNRVAKWDATAGKMKFVDPASLVVITNLNQVGNVATTAPATNDALVWNGAAWEPSSSAIQFTFEQMSNGPGTMVGAAGKVLIVNALETELEYADLATWLGAAGVALDTLTDVNVTEGPGIDGKVLTWNNATNKWIASSVPAALSILSGATTIDAATSHLKFTGTGVTVTQESAGHVLVDVDIPPQLAFQDHGSPVSTPNTINFAGNCTVGSSGGILTLTVTGVSVLSGLSDVLITSPAGGDVLTWDAPASKWKNKSLSAAIALLPNTLQPATYEFGPFAPPDLTTFNTLVNASGLTNQVQTGRGFLSVPGTYGSTGYAFYGRAVTANSPPWQITSRVVANAGAIGGYYAGIAIRRSASDAYAFVGVSPNGNGTNDHLVIFSYKNAGGETTVTTVKTDAHYVRLGYDGTNVKAYWSYDGLLWEQLGSVNAATVFSGVPDQCGICHRVVNGVAANVAGLYTYWDDPDYPAGARTTSAFGTLGLNELTNVDTATPTDGQYLQYQSGVGKWVPTNPPYKVGAFFTITPGNSETLLLHAVVTPVTFAANFAGSRAVVGVNPTATFIMDVKKNGSTIGTVSISTSGVATFATTGGLAQSAVAGDLISIVAPAVADATVADLAMTLLGS